MQAYCANMAAAHLVKAVTLSLLKANRRKATRDLRAASRGDEKEKNNERRRRRAAILTGRNIETMLMTVVEKKCVF